MTTYSDRPWQRHYDYWIPHTMRYPERPLYDILDISAVDYPDSPATAFFGATLTFAEIKARSDRFATALAGFGISKGDRVGIMLPNCPQYIIAAFAVLRHGAVIVNINPTYTARELLTVANDSGIRVLITLDALAPLVLAVRAQTSIEEIVMTSVAEYTAAAAAPPQVEGTRAFTDLVQGVPEAKVIRAAVAPGDLAVLQYTGGTTGTPKGAMLTHQNIFANVVQAEAFMNRTRERGVARYLLVIPYFHIYAFTVGMMQGVWVAGLQIMLPKYDVEQVLAAIKQYRPTYFPAVPTVFVSLLNHPRAKEFGLDKVRTFNSGGAPCPVEVIEQWERTFGRPLNEGYGLSETSPVTHTTPQLAIRKPGSIGIPVLDTEIKIVDVETGTREMPVGEAGELCVSGPQVMKGYWQRRDETERVLRPDDQGRLWFHTGDIARMDEDGFFSIVQRKKDMIIVDGFNVYPSEVETVIYMHPAVRLVAVIGVPDAYHGEVVKACVVLKQGASVTPAELITHCKSDLAPYKVPKQVELRNDLPMSAVGKILYRVLRDEIAASAPAEATGIAEKR
jgi:long-chain acyl-CoA synthetase